MSIQVPTESVRGVPTRAGKVQKGRQLGAVFEHLTAARALHAPQTMAGAEELTRLPASQLRSRACQNIVDIGWD